MSTLIFVVSLILLMAAGFIVVGACMNAYERNARAKAIKTTGVLVGYWSRGGSREPLKNPEKLVYSKFQKKLREILPFGTSPCYPIISFSDNGETVEKNAVQCYRMWPDTHPIGGVYNITYRKKWGYNLQIDEDGLRDFSLFTVAKILFGIGGVLVVVAGVVGVLIWRSL
ncbi:MAG: hypothetical protein FWH20_07910 [Oscillospiraceae bacterium]|nr:hypothetical protein [Oscillospiraceae bacterium]